MDNSQTNAISEMIQAALNNTYTMLPGQIVLYDGLSATVQPVLSKKFLDGIVLPMPPISGVPVKIMGTNRSSFTIDLLPGDPGLLFFAARDSTNYVKSGTPALPPATGRKFDYNDCFFVPFDSRTIIPDLNFRPLSTTIGRVDPGTINIKNVSQNLGLLMFDLTTALMGLTTEGTAVAQAVSFTSAAKILAIQIRFLALTGIL